MDNLKSRALENSYKNATHLYPFFVREPARDLKRGMAPQFWSRTKFYVLNKNIKKKKKKKSYFWFHVYYRNFQLLAIK